VNIQNWEEIAEKNKIPFNPTPKKKQENYFVIFNFLRNIIKIYYFFYSTKIRGNETCCPCPTCCFPCSPGPCADRASFCPSKASTHRKLRLRRRYSPDSLCWKDKRMQFCNRETKTKNKKKQLCLGTLKFPDQVV
jgi:hypothetical protein